MIAHNYRLPQKIPDVIFFISYKNIHTEGRQKLYVQKSRKTKS